MSTLTGWSLWRWPRSPAPDAGLYESVPSESCCCGPEPGAAWPWCGRQSAFDPVSTAWPPSAPPSPGGLDPMELRPQTTGFQVRSRAPAALQSDPPALQHPWNTTTGVCQLFYFMSTQRGGQLVIYSILLRMENRAAAFYRHTTFLLIGVLLVNMM